MVKSLKKLVISAVTFCILSSFITTTAVFAAPVTKNVDLEKASQEYGLKDITSVPEGIQAIEFKNVAELEKFLADSKKKNDDEKALYNKKVTELSKISTNDASSNTIMATTATTSSQTKTVESAGMYWYNLTANYTYTNGYFSTCTSISTSINGVCPGIEYSQTSSYYQIIDGRRTLACSVLGHEKVYLLVNGVIKLYETDKSFYAEFYL